MSEPYLTGNVLRVPAVFKDVNGAAADPTTVTFKYRKPGESTRTSLVYLTDGALVKDSTGNYHVDLTLDTAGLWTFWWVTTGTPAKTYRGTFSVADSDVA